MCKPQEPRTKLLPAVQGLPGMGRGSMGMGSLGMGMRPLGMMGMGMDMMPGKVSRSAEIITYAMSLFESALEDRENQEEMGLFILYAGVRGCNALPAWQFTNVQLNFASLAGMMGGMMGPSDVMGMGMGLPNENMMGMGFDGPGQSTALLSCPVHI